MKNIVIIGNYNSDKDVSYWCNYFSKRGCKVLDYPKDPTKDSKLDPCYNFFEYIKDTDILFILNNEKNGLDGYIDTTTFSKITYSIMKNLSDKKKRMSIYILKLPTSSLCYYNEILSFINNGQINLFRENFKIDLAYELMEYESFDDQELGDKNLFLEYMKLYTDQNITPKVSHLLTKENKFAHFTASAFVTNKDKTKLLMVHNNVFNGWSYPSKHTSGEEDLLLVVTDEVKKITGQTVKILNDFIFSIQAIPIPSYIIDNEYVSPHIHLDVVFLLEMDDTDSFTFNTNTIKNIKWVSMKNILNGNNEDIVDFLKPVHLKLVKRFLANMKTKKLKPKKKS